MKLFALKHFCFIFFHAFTFVILLHCYGMMVEHPVGYTSSELYFVALIITMHICMLFFHLSQMLQYITVEPHYRKGDIE